VVLLSIDIEMFQMTLHRASVFYLHILLYKSVCSWFWSYFEYFYTIPSIRPVHGCVVVFAIRFWRVPVTNWRGYNSPIISCRNLFVYFCTFLLRRRFRVRALLLLFVDFYWFVSPPNCLVGSVFLERWIELIIRLFLWQSWIACIYVCISSFCICYFTSHCMLNY